MHDQVIRHASKIIEMKIKGLKLSLIIWVAATLNAFAQDSSKGVLLEKGDLLITYSYSLCDVNGLDLGFYLLSTENESESKSYSVQIFDGAPSENRLITSTHVLPNEIKLSECSNEGMRLYIYNPIQDDFVPNIEDLNITVKIIEE